MSTFADPFVPVNPDPRADVALPYTAADCAWAAAEFGATTTDYEVLEPEPEDFDLNPSAAVRPRLPRAVRRADGSDDSFGAMCDGPAPRGRGPTPCLKAWVSAANDPTIVRLLIAAAYH